MTALSARDGYRHWAPRYDAETAVSQLEDILVADLGVATAGLTLLDAGCGTARRLRDADAATVVGADLSMEMLGQSSDVSTLAAADVRALPFMSAAFDVVWCRLVVGHLRELEAAYAELSRVCRVGGSVVVTDIAPEAIAAGHRRTFRDGNGEKRELEHFVHSLDRHLACARVAGLGEKGQREGVVGPEIEQFYRVSGRMDAYDAQRGLPLVVAFAFRRLGA
jgi:malonyl-CoA O-methyltransferase